MPEFVRLHLQAEDGHPLVHKFRRHREGATGLLVLLPGHLYSGDGPLLYYPNVILGERGWDTLALTYSYQVRMEPCPEILDEVVSESWRVVEAVLSGGEYPRVGVIGKSLGAGVAAQMCRGQEALRRSRAVFLTPMLGSTFFDEAFVETKQAALLVQGTGDGFHDPQTLARLQERRAFQLRLIEGGDHSLQIAGDLRASLEALRSTTDEVVAFLTA